MELLNKIKRHREANTLRSIKNEAESQYSIELFNGKLYYAYDGIPLVGISENTNAAEMIERLSKLKQTYTDWSVNKRQRVDNM